MATEPEPSTSTASDTLMTQVNRDNVLQVRNSIKTQADEIQQALHLATWQMDVGLCGGDPISRDAASAFNTKIEDVLRLHWAHHKELSAAVERLTRTAHTYGYTEKDIAESLAKMRSAP